MPGWGVGLVAVAVVVAVLLVVDRAVARGRFDGVHLSVRSQRQGGESAGSGLLGDLVEVFRPSHQHVVEEQQRQRLDVVREGDAAPPGPAERPGPRPAAPGDSEPTVP